MSLRKFMFASVVLAAAGARAAEDTEYDDMGPAAFMWPPDRVWSAEADNTAPCGSSASPGNRTNFPLQNGQVALVAQDESWDIELSIAYMDDPLSDNDFDLLIDADQFRELDLGHTCVTLPSSPDSVIAGDLATIQVKYIADFDSPDNQTFYACTDVVMVALVEFDATVPCFNATVEDDGAGNEYDFHDEHPVGDDQEGSDSGSSAGSTENENSEEEEKSNSSGSSKLSGGTISGIVVGSVAGGALSAAALLFLYRRRQRQKSLARQAATSRGVKWEEQEQTGKVSVSNTSVRMQNLSASP